MTMLPVAGRAEIIWLERRVAAPGFTARDRAELARWGSEPSRKVVWDADPTELAMLYQASTTWASWAVARQEGRLIVWDCVTFADIGYFDSMVDALAAVCGAGSDEKSTLSNVLSFVDARQRRVGAASVATSQV